MRSNLFDIHAHVHFAAFDGDRREVMERTLQEGVASIQVGTQLDTSRAAVSLAESYPEGVYATVGLHPIHTSASYHDEKELGEGGKAFTSRGELFDAEKYRELARSGKVVAIGECGLDYYRLGENTKQVQKEVFEAQIALANELGKPLMLHIRNAYKDAYEMLKSLARVRGDVHFFAGTWEEAKLFLDLGFTLSFTGVITFARTYDEVVKNTPLDMIMTETDCPYIAPVPFRGKRNEPRHVREVVKQIALLRGETYETIAQATVENATRVFGLDKLG
jgi:TatD DNase family protein